MGCNVIMTNLCAVCAGEIRDVPFHLRWRGQRADNTGIDLTDCTVLYHVVNENFDGRLVDATCTLTEAAIGWGTWPLNGQFDSLTWTKGEEQKKLTSRFLIIDGTTIIAVPAEGGAQIVYRNIPA